MLRLIVYQNESNFTSFSFRAFQPSTQSVEEFPQILNHEQFEQRGEDFREVISNLIKLICEWVF